MQNLILNTPPLHYIVYIHEAGLEDDFPPGLAITDRLAISQRWQASWNNIDAMAPSGGRFKLNDLPIMRRTSMFRDGFLILCRYKKNNQKIQSHSKMLNSTFSSEHHPIVCYASASGISAQRACFYFSFSYNLIGWRGCTNVPCTFSVAQW